MLRDNEIAHAALLIMTTWNAFLGILMIFEILPVFYGMSLAFGGMCGIIFASWRTLMGDERPWESRSQYLRRTQK